MINKKQDIIKAAFSLFSQNGFHATGIDQIIAVSKTSKKTLYAHFKSKDDLVAAVLQHYQNEFEEDVRQELLNIDHPQKKLFRLFAVAYDWYSSKKFNGCLAISAMNEYGNKNEEIRAACESFKMAEYQILEKILKDMKITPLNKTANNLMILLEGITATAHINSIKPTSKDIEALVKKVIH